MILLMGKGECLTFYNDWPVSQFLHSRLGHWLFRDILALHFPTGASQAILSKLPFNCVILFNENIFFADLFLGYPIFFLVLKYVQKIPSHWSKLF
jgi:hypothetical protein